MDQNALRFHVNQGNAYLAAHHFQQALAEYHKALEIDPGNPIAKANISAVHNTWGITYFKQHKFKEALHEFEVCLQENPHNPNARDNIAKLQNMLVQQGISLDDGEMTQPAHVDDELAGQAPPTPAAPPHPQGALGADHVDAYAGDAAGAPAATSSAAPVITPPAAPTAVGDSEPGEPQVKQVPSDHKPQGVEEAQMSPARDSGEYGSAVIMSLPQKNAGSNNAAPHAIPPAQTPSSPPSTIMLSNTAPDARQDAPAPAVSSNTGSTSHQSGPIRVVLSNTGPVPQDSYSTVPPQSAPVPRNEEPPVVLPNLPPPVVVPVVDNNAAPQPSLQETLAALEKKVEGRIHTELSASERIDRLEKELGGKVREGTMIERVERLRKEVGL
jgi:hypothetical protein